MKKAVEASPLQKKRQKRGQERIDSLLNAAEEVFAEVGYERATTNLIAQRAGASPGTLYQFFRNKEEVAFELAHRHIERFKAIQALYLTEDSVDDDLTATIDSTVDPLLSFEQSVLAMEAIELAMVLNPELRSKAASQHQSGVERLSRMIKSVLPRLRNSEVMRVYTACGAIFHGFLPVIRTAAPRQRGPLIKELKTVLYRYLEPYQKERKS